MESAWIYPETTAVDELMDGVRLQVIYVHVVGKKERWEIYPHVQEGVEFCYVAGGQGTYHLEDAEMQATEGDLFVVLPGVTHWEAQAVGHWIELVFIYVAISGDFADRLLDALRPIQGKVPWASDEQKNKARGLIRQIVSEAEARTPGSSTAMDAATVALVVTLLGEMKGDQLAQAPVTPRRTQRIILQVKQFITANVQGDLSVESIARQFHYHPKYLSNLFRQETGRTLTEWISMTKVHTAQELLATTQMSMEDVARLSGFSSVSHLYQRFKEDTGLTPGKYRQR